MRIDPPVSVPIEAKHMPSATDAADPPDEPPGDRVGSSGCRAGPNADSSLVVPYANSCRLVFPTKTAPASRNLAIEGASLRATWFIRTRDAAVVADPRMSNRSLMEIGTPVQSAAVAAGGYLAVGLARLCPGVGFEDRDEGVDRGIALGDPVQASIEGGLRSRLARLERARQLRNRLHVSGHLAPHGVRIRRWRRRSIQPS
jgi:hypothetical protein